MDADFIPANVFGPNANNPSSSNLNTYARDYAFDHSYDRDTPMTPSSLFGDASSATFSYAFDSDDEDLYIDANQGGSTRQGVPSSVAEVHPATSTTFNNPSAGVDNNAKPLPKSSSKELDLDLSHSIKGLYRILDLISEQGSGGGLVDKIIISQDSLQAFANDVQPGAYTSLTKVDFKLLDKVLVSPVGIYGDKKSIVEFLDRLGVVEKETAVHLLKTEVERGRTSPYLRSGLYALRVLPSGIEGNRVYVIHWPEDTTWDDGAISSVRRNRITFMRYLSKICDQTIALISTDYAQSIVWKESEDDDLYMDSDDEGPERMYAFEVCKTNEQEESVKIRPGFTARAPVIAPTDTRLDKAPDNTLPMRPRLIPGETTQGLITAGYRAAIKSVDHFKDRPINKAVLENHIKDPQIRLSFSAALDQPTIDILMDSGLRSRCGQLCRKFNSERSEARQKLDSEIAQRKAESLAKINQGQPLLSNSFRNFMIERILDVYPVLDVNRLQQKPLPIETQTQGAVLDDLVANYPKVKPLIERVRDEQPLRTVPGAFHSSKERILIINHLLDSHSEFLDEKTQAKLVDMIDGIKDIHKAWTGMSKGLRSEESSQGYLTRLRSGLKSLLPHEGNRSREKAYKDALDVAQRTSDIQFMSHAKDMASRWPVLGKAINAATAVVYDHFTKNLGRLSDKYAHETMRIQEEECAQQFNREHSSRTDQNQRDLCSDFARKLNDHFSKVSSRRELHVSAVRKTGYWTPYSPTLAVRGRLVTTEDDQIVYRAHLMQLTVEDRHELQLDSSFIPSPRFGVVYTFSLPTGSEIIYSQLLENDHLLLLTSDRRGNILVYRESLDTLERAIAHERYKTKLSRDKIGEDVLIAFNEAKQMLAVCEAQKLQLHFFVFDEDARSLKASGSAINLALYYDGVTIQQASFICGDEELLLVDSSARGRIFSLLTMQFRPATLQFATVPFAVYTSPDGSCFLALCSHDSSFSITAYHWSTFGSNEGTQLAIDDLRPEDDIIMTSFDSRNSVHLMRFDAGSQTCKSFALDITRKSTEFMFMEKGGRSAASADKSGNTLHNCLIDCHSEVWTRFPVLPAIQRQAITMASSRRPKSLMFVSDVGQKRFSPYFSELIQTFERTARKLTGNELRSITIGAMTFNDLYSSLNASSSSQTSQFRAGEWLVELLCLIPIHLAITKDNRFIPLKDGVFSPELEKSLLGAEVGRIVDSLSFGWYESIFQSYMASKPVKVVSSMGEQSVGKSFALNHLADTSFAGSAMRTTEGVWMSVTPTEETLVVALDFEGVHSIERSAQEDTLLVLFNTAISNLVLFRNNFALNRDITGLFQSFQSSSTVLDPAANPMLFQSTLVIIIKDVVDSDAPEIKKEFSLKFRKIVQDEQESNFISRLHGGKLDIIPWPVIESKEFYKLFPRLKKRLDQQRVTHPAAGQFLHTVKTLMAKLKSNDWGALSHTMASHRALQLHNMLPNALESGFTLSGIEQEPLKNIDTDEFVSADDTATVFAVGSSGTNREACLAALEQSWDRFSTRQQTAEETWFEGLASHVDNLLTLRINRVGEWISLNLVRFQAVSHESIEELKRAFESTTVDMRSNVQLCGAQCTSCHLRCIQSRLHQGQHDCKTNHKCSHDCDFCEDDAKMCGMNAGHPGKHICVVSSHLCGAPCVFSGRQGCLEACTKFIDHDDDEHTCAASAHACGEPCDLGGVRLADGSTYYCPGTCSEPSDREHTQHRCDTRMCPITCMLCKRLCSHGDHLHGLHRGETHLCGQEHSCKQNCSRHGICEIDTAPTSIEATFTGRHETFQYTKYSQVSKRLKCVKPIPAGATEHTGEHTHSTDPNVIHFCEKRCDYCGYFCTQPLGHPQKEHETRHGSMSQTRWAIDGEDDAAIEVEGRKYAANDDGAPMMCNLVCQTLGRHAHITYCRAATAAECTGNDEIQHIPKRLKPDPDREKDSITHSLFWKRNGFKDPYSREEQANFARCDAMCGGPEHTAPGLAPSYCTLPIFHPPRDPANAPATGHVSSDGHVFACRNPVVMQQAFHVIFVIDRSASMGIRDRRPLPGTPTTALISKVADNRLGAVFSALHSFWTARHAAVTAGGEQAGNVRRDAYSVVMFDHEITTALTNDFESTPEELLSTVLAYRARGGTNFTGAMKQARAVMETHWSTERTPVIIFLSDGECSIADTVMEDVCRSAIRLGKAVSLQTVSFGENGLSTSLRRMAEIAADAQANAPRDPLAPASATVKSAFSQALDSVQLAETFLGIAESLRKQRGSLIH